MGSKMRHGDGDDATILDQDFTDTTAATTDGDDCRDIDSVGVQLIAGYLEEGFSGSDSDSVVAATDTWTLTEFDFTGLVGATIRVTGTASNDGDHVITNVTSAHVIRTTASTTVDETFTAAMRVTVIHTEDPPVGTWKIEVSNDFVPDTNGTVYGQVSASGTWTDITSQFSPAIAAVTSTFGAANNQYAQEIGRAHV